jgi:hypothetical protein
MHFGSAAPAGVGADMLTITSEMMVRVVEIWCDISNTCVVCVLVLTCCRHPERIAFASRCWLEIGLVA